MVSLQKRKPASKTGPSGNQMVKNGRHCLYYAPKTSVLFYYTTKLNCSFYQPVVKCSINIEDVRNPYAISSYSICHNN